MHRRRVRFQVSFFNQLRGGWMTEAFPQFRECMNTYCSNNSLFTLQTISSCPFLNNQFCQRSARHLSDEFNNKISQLRAKQFERYLTIFKSSFQTSIFSIIIPNSKILHAPSNFTILFSPPVCHFQDR